MPKHHTPPEQKHQHIAAWRNSGLSRSTYARSQGINPKTFMHWVTEYHSGPAPQKQQDAFIPAAIEAVRPISLPDKPVTLNLARCP